MQVLAYFFSKKNFLIVVAWAICPGTCLTIILLSYFGACSGPSVAAMRHFGFGMHLSMREVAIHPPML